tara:strand:- start:4127 stop:4477 length:351 start_codon:yes stop_codon:yes gene_type:complete
MVSKNSVNKVILVGHVGQKPELNYTPNGFAVASFSVATNEMTIDPEKNKTEHTEWHNIVAWNKLADFSKKYIKKGQLIYIEGRIHTQTWVDKKNIQHKRIEIVANTITPLAWKNKD